MANGPRRCSLCGRIYPPGRDFRTIRLPDNSITYVCKGCAPRIDDIDRLFPATHEEGAKSDDRRQHNRRQAHLLLSFTHVRGSVVYPGLVRDISQGGMRFSTQANVEPKEFLNLNVFSPLTGLHIETVGRVRWVVERKQHNDIGVEFTAGDRRMRLDDRRKHRRILAEFVLHCNVEGKAIEGRVKDISQSGIRFVTTAPLPEGKTITVKLAAAGADIVGAEGGFTLSIEKTLVIVSTKQSAAHYEIRARFLTGPIGK